jgi:hypothetical protein
MPVPSSILLRLFCNLLRLHLHCLLCAFRLHHMFRHRAAHLASRVTPAVISIFSSLALVQWYTLHTESYSPFLLRVVIVAAAPLAVVPLAPLLDAPAPLPAAAPAPLLDAPAPLPAVPPLSVATSAVAARAPVVTAHHPVAVPLTRTHHIRSYALTDTHKIKSQPSDVVLLITHSLSLRGAPSQPKPAPPL